MKKSFVKIVLAALILVAGILPIKSVEAASFDNVSEKYKDTYVVKYGSQVAIKKEAGEMISVDEPAIAVIENDSIKVIGTGHFTVTVKSAGKEEKINFFAWNAYLEKGKYWTYSDINRNKKVAVVYSKVYFAVSETENAKTLKVEDYFFRGGKYSGELKGKYITNYYNKTTKKSTTSYYQYAFESNLSYTPVVQIEKITLNYNKYALKVGESVRLEASIEPKVVTDATLSWTSSDSSVAKVENGVVTALKKGTAKIIAKSNNGKQDECIITVTENEETTITKEEKVKSIKLNKINATLKINGTLELEATIEPSNATNKTITWTSSDTSIAKVENGKVTALKKGSVRIMARSSNGKTATCTIIIREEVVKRVKLNKTNASLKINETIQLEATIEPSNANNKTMTWTSSDSSVAKVENGKVTALKSGTAKITVKSNNGKSATCTINVLENKEKLEVHYIDPNSRVDAIYIKVGDKSIFIDGGFYNDAKAEIAYLKRLGVTKIDYYIGSHAHSNHVGAAGPIISTFNIDTMYTSTAKYNGQYSAIYMMLSKAKTTAEKNAIKNCKHQALKTGDTLQIGDLKIICLGPISLTKTSPGATAENKNSLILRFEYGNTSFLMAGDTGATQLNAAEKNNPGSLNVDVYKNSHHNSSLSESVLKKIQPKYVVFTTKDGYLPSSSYLNTIKKNNAKYYIATTKKDKSVLFTSDGEEIKVQTKYNSQ